MAENTSLPLFVKKHRQLLGLTQAAFAARCGVGIRFIRDLEQGKATLRMDKVNQVLSYFGYELAAVPASREAGAQAE